MSWADEESAKGCVHGMFRRGQAKKINTHEHIDPLHLWRELVNRILVVDGPEFDVLVCWSLGRDMACTVEDDQFDLALLRSGNEGGESRFANIAIWA